MSNDAYLVGLDFGTLSCRAAVVRASDGEVLATADAEYPHAVMDRKLSAGDGQELPSEFALQVAGDYLEALASAVPEAVQAADVDRGSRDTKELEVERPARGGGLGAPFRLAFAGEWSVGAQRCRLPGRTRAARPVGDRRRGQGVGFARAAACPVVCLRARRARC